MYTHSLPMRLLQALAPRTFALGVIVTLTLLSAACGDINSSPLSSSLSNAATSNFAVLAKAAVTCTDATITGDVGTFHATPTGSVTLTRCPVIGTVHVGDGVAMRPTTASSTRTRARAEAVGRGRPDGYARWRDAVARGLLFRCGRDVDGRVDAQRAFERDLAFQDRDQRDRRPHGHQLLGGHGRRRAGLQCDVVGRRGRDDDDSDFLGNILAGAAITLTGGTFNGNAWAKSDVTITGTAPAGCEGGTGNGAGNDKRKCNQGVGNGPEGCDPGNSNHHNPSNDENGGTPGDPGRKGAN